MTKNELIKKYAKKMDIPQDDSKKLLEGLQKLIVNTLKDGEDVTLMELGKFRVEETSERTYEIKGKSGVIPAGKKVKFKNLGLLKELFKLKN